MLSDEVMLNGREWIACALENVDAANRRGFLHGMLTVLEAFRSTARSKRCDNALEWLLKTNDSGGISHVMETLAVHHGIDFPDAGIVLAERDRYTARVKDLEERLSVIVLTAQGRCLAPIDEAVANGWRPIESAPHTGYVIVLYEGSAHEALFVKHVGGGGKWRLCFRGANGQEMFPSHWQPMPKPFKPAKGG